MPPKNAAKGGGPSKKTEQKKKEKIIEDKTFGLKNKKGSKQQKFIQQVQHQVKHGGNKTARELEKERESQIKKKDEKKKELEELNKLFKPVQQMAGKGSDPKSILCQFFKQGTCGKGQKCKFSHDLAIERKAEKRSLYVDMRDDEEPSDGMDEAQVREMAERKASKQKNKPQTEKPCKHFLEAVENSKYGWFWECPNGDSCIFRHALPPGYVLKKDKKKMEKMQEEISLEELVDRERAALGPETTRVTLETFLAWKKRKLKEKEEQEKKDADKKKKDFSAGRALGLSGREMFTFNPTMMDGEMDEGDESVDVTAMEKDPETEEEERFEFKEIDMNELMSDYKEVEAADSAGMSIANPDRLTQLKDLVGTQEAAAAAAAAAAAGEGAEASGGVDIDEDLFDGDEEDLDDLEEQLGEMTVT